ncbi:MAG: Oligopeptide ABC transporter, periplasmic oligopeptide-binding protein OppA [uncultured Thermomicrobiales bacterium]|uniref:Oligopeptide ABC transporter, periplasmic oligopeptide-binding protein OppA n=1 Tax=uncultured Thermomicrobiales bacterium TaxID=1645740 RepID=A0A6J4U3H6_9BACT|nr:MAG: Oligopeptide ABC transporter, periplasmic oligopeptide-binding protein OppA [uncultured Thermomicrobiales bacterium]
MRGPRIRSFGWLAALLVAVLLAPTARLVAQDGTPAASPVASPGASPAASPIASPEGSPVAQGETIQSPTRDQLRAEIDAELGYTEAARQGGTFIDSGVADIQTLNPLLSEEVQTGAVMGLIYDTLLGSDPRTGQPAPLGLADRWEIAPDRVTYTFFLNQNATFHDGVDVTSEDVVFSMDALADEATGSTYTGTFNNAVASYRAIDPDTVELVATEPLVSFLYDIGALYIVPKHIWGDVPFDQWRTHPGSTGQDTSMVVGSGPFKFQEWRQGESVTLARNDAFYGKVPNIDAYSLRIWPDQQQVVNALLNDELDTAGLEPADVSAIEGTEGIVVTDYPTQSFTYIEYNLDPAVTTLFQDARVRQALFYAMDRESIVNDILLGYGEVAQGTQPVISYAYAPDRIEPQYTYDPERARQLLAEAGWTDTNGNGTVDREGQEMAFEYLYPAGSPTNDQIVAYIQDAWSQVGVEITPRSLEFPALIEATTTTPTFAVAQYGFNWDASFIQDAMFGCDQYQVGFNDMRYCNPQLDEIHNQARREFDEARRADLLIQASNIVNQDVPVMVTHFSQEIVAYNDRLQNYTPGPWGTELPYVWIQE